MRLGSILALMGLVACTTPSLAFDIEAAASGYRKTCMNRTLADTRFMNMLMGVGFSATDYCACMGETLASQIAANDLRIAQNEGYSIPVISGDRVTISHKRCVVMLEMRQN